MIFILICLIKLQFLFTFSSFLYLLINPINFGIIPALNKVSNVLESDERFFRAFKIFID